MAAGTHVRHFSVSLSGDALQRLMGHDIPDELAPLVDPTISNSRILQLKTPVEIRRIVRSLIDSPLQGRLRDIEIEGALTQIFA